MAGPLKSAIMTVFQPVRAAIMVALACLLVIGCTRPSPQPETQRGMGRAKFVAVMRELTFAEPEARAAILQKHNVSEADLRKAVEALSSDPATLSHVLDSIHIGMDRDRFLSPDRFPPRFRE